MAAAAFLDRDGTLNVRPEPHEYVESIEDFEWLPGAAEGAARLAEAGYILIVVSNQRGVALGRVTAGLLDEIEDRIQEGIGRYGQRVAAFRYCLHDSVDGCSCRKPQPGLLLDAAREYDLSLPNSWMIGDSATDACAGRAAGCKTALVGDQEMRCDAADVRASSLGAAAQAILVLDDWV